MNLQSWPRGPDRPIARAEVHLWRASVDQGGWSSTRSLPPAERERAERLLHPLSRARWSASRWALRQVLARYLDADPVTIELRPGERGKPALADPAAALRFNLSHSGGLVLIALTEGREVGVDIEWVDPRRNVIALANRGLPPAKSTAIRNAPPASRARAFHEAWARREALLKCLGSGLGGPLPRARVRVSPLDVGPGYAGALALAGHRAIPQRRFSLPAA
ncbi:MAG: 4'-phosphopantetheinyl transferase superfamily protein [Solirubrobacterales bacterium]